MRLRFSRLSLLWKIMLSTSVAVTALFALTGEIVLGNVTRTMSGSLEEEAQHSFRAYTALWASRANLLSSVSRIMSEMPNVRAAFSTGDAPTIQDSMGEIWRKVSQANALFLVTDPTGRVIANLGDVPAESMGKSVEVVRAAAAKIPSHVDDPQSPGINGEGGFFLHESGPPQLYQLSITPVYVQSTQGESLNNFLVAGFQVDALLAQQLKEDTGSDYLFLTPRTVIASTLNPRATSVVRANLEHAKPSKLVSDGIADYAWYRKPLLDISGHEVAEICILRSFDAAHRRIAALYTNIILLWLGAMAAGLGLTYLLARRIVEPVKQLDRAAAEVGRQNYAIAVEVRSEDEMGRLAQTFNAMCASIRQAREDLIRQERISTIGRLSGSIVHDLRNPLAAIYGGAEMLVDTDLPPTHVKRLAGNIYRASRRIQELLSDLLNVSRGKTTAAEVCRLREVAQAACDFLAESASLQQVDLCVDIPPEIELPLERSRMERAFVNLIGNAIEAMADGGQVRITAELDSGYAVVHVRDNGPGVPPQILSQIFQPFVTAGKRNGLGLGLALTRQTVLEHGGEMWVESEPGRGACFSFRLPGAHVAAERAGGVMIP